MTEDVPQPAGEGYLALRFQRRFAHPREVVWRALTEPAGLGFWYPFEVDTIDLRVGGQIVFDAEEGGAPDTRITELDSPQVFAFDQFDDETAETHGLHFRLEAEPGGCTLFFTHTFSERLWDEGAQESGWRYCLDDLEMLLENPEAAQPEGAPAQP
ncbi:hypothetical protein GCM10027570_26060 [Streptomonospora sediminis]